MDEFDEKRRNFLIKALSYGMFATGASGLSVPAWAMGQVPGELPPGRSIYRLKGKVKVDGRLATLETPITFKSTIETGADGSIVFAVGKDAFILRSHGKLEMRGSESILTGLRLITGKLLSVFGKRQPEHRLGVSTVVATIGIRGTGMYIESEPDQSYICTCYGTADLSSIKDAQSKETVVTKHHDAPRYILANAPAGQGIRQAPVINHTDEELELIESLVGRSVPFAYTGDYDSLRKTSY
jgi:hypothetical protein